MLWWATASPLDMAGASALGGSWPSRVWGGSAAALLLPPPAKGSEKSFCVALESRASCSGIISYITLASQAAREGQSRFINVVLTLIMFVEQCCKKPFDKHVLPWLMCPSRVRLRCFSLPLPTRTAHRFPPAENNRALRSVRTEYRSSRSLCCPVNR